ncbi:MAG: hypothetical protein ACRC15_04145, partial [Cetobacterium sp.]
MLKKERVNIFLNKKVWGFLFFASIFIFLFGIKEYKEYKKEEELRVERLLNKINLKIELFMSSIGDLENTEPIKEYYNSNEISYYNLIKVLQEIQKKNNIYGKSGYTLSLGKDNSDIVVTGDGTKNKDNYLKTLGIEEKKQEDLNSNLILIPQEKQISFILKNKIFNLEEGIFWIVNLDRELFFSDLFGDGVGKWEILKDNKIYHLDKNIVTKRKGNDGYILRSSGLNLKFLYTPNYSRFYQMLFLMSIVIFLALGLLAMLIDYSIKLYKERKELIGEINTLAVVDRRKNLRDFVLGIRKIHEVG